MDTTKLKLSDITPLVASFSILVSCADTIGLAATEHSQFQRSNNKFIAQRLNRPADKNIRLLTPELQAELGLKCDDKDVVSGYRVEEIKPDTEASKNSMQIGDRIVDARMLNDELQIAFERGDQMITVSLHVKNPGAVTMPLDLAPPQSGVQTQTGKVEQLTSGAGNAVGMSAIDGAPPVAPSRFKRGVSETGELANKAPIPLRAENFDAGIDKTKLAQAVQKPNLLPRVGGAMDGRNVIPLKTQQTNLTGKADTNTNPERPKTGIRLLADYNVELIIDASNSMRKRDCPGFTSRWEWCAMQASDLSRRVAPFLPQGLGITTFASDYDVFPNSGPQRIADLFDRQSLHFGTKLAEPLSDRINNYLSNRNPKSKPLLVCIITDGIPVPPDQPPRVINTIIRTTKKMNYPTEVTIVFFQIGGRDFAGRDFIAFCDNQLTRSGARYDIVNAVPFEDLVRVGLARALTSVVEQYGNNRPPQR